MEIIKGQNNLRHPSIWRTIAALQAATHYSDLEMAETMQVTLPHFIRLRRHQLDLPIRAGLALCDHFRIAFDSLVTGDFDLLAVTKQFMGGSAYLPEKYMVGASSRRSTVINLLDYIHKRLGPLYRIQMLRRFQVPEEALRDPLGPINLRLSVDIASLIQRQYDDNQMIIGMGRNFVEISKKTPMGAELRAARNVRELYEIFQECNIVERYMERNCQWRVAFVGAHRCIVEGTPEREFISMLGKEYMTSEAACLVRQGFIASIPGYLGYPPANIRKLSCVARGDSSCRYDLDFLPILKSNDRRFQTVQQQA